MGRGDGSLRCLSHLNYVTLSLWIDTAQRSWILWCANYVTCAKSATTHNCYILRDTPVRPSYYNEISWSTFQTATVGVLVK